MISIGGLAVAWLVYDQLCRVLRDERLLAAAVFGFVVLAT